MADLFRLFWNGSLAAIAGYTDLLLRGARDDAAVANQVLHTMLAEEERMQRLLQRMLSLARLDAGPPTRMEEVDVATLVADLAREIAVLAPALQVRYEGVPCATVRAAGDELRQALLNLADNARRYTPENGQIVFSVQVDERRVLVKIWNSDAYLPPEALAHLFDRFYRADASRARDTGGTGLGLAITRAITRRQGGEITASSTAEGTTFTVGLPAIRT